MPHLLRDLYGQRFDPQAKAEAEVRGASVGSDSSEETEKSPDPIVRDTAEQLGLTEADTWFSEEHGFLLLVSFHFRELPQSDRTGTF